MVPENKMTSSPTIRVMARKCISAASLVLQNEVGIILQSLTTQRKTPLTEYTLQCEYSQLTGIEALLGQCDGKIINSDYQAFVLLRVALPAAKVAEFSAKLADFSRGSLQLLAIEENPHFVLQN